MLKHPLCIDNVSHLEQPFNNTEKSEEPIFHTSRQTSFEPIFWIAVLRIGAIVFNSHELHSQSLSQFSSSLDILVKNCCSRKRETSPIFLSQSCMVNHLRSLISTLSLMIAFINSTSFAILRSIFNSSSLFDLRSHFITSSYSFSNSLPSYISFKYSSVAFLSSSIICGSSGLTISSPNSSSLSLWTLCVVLKFIIKLQ
ncbi:unnamed protein product [Moneuplotes crassus]|uniref:Uncharacterized protein n=1 Tax=Euplotes crassus TaxID=5936 RepID=A0AAD1XMC7_EUPCR|nr:unnamed protein product [Moneuplotes crassus]